METTRDIFIKNLRRIRNERKLTQNGAADLIGSTLRYWQKMEHGQSFPSPEYIDRICKALKVYHWQLFDSPGSPRVRKVGDMTREELLEAFATTTVKRR